MAEAPDDWGSFDGEILTKWLTNDGDDVLMELRGPLAFVRATRFATRVGEHYPAHSGLIFDGASIPRFLWPIMGGPFEGDYRLAAIIHDQLCRDRCIPSPLVHRIFYEAMRASGVPGWRAWLMWAAVRVFGPRWQVPTDWEARIMATEAARERRKHRHSPAAPSSTSGVTP